MKIRIAGTVSNSIVDGPGIRYTIFVQGCPHNCKGCQNPTTHNFSGGHIIDTDEIYKDIISDPLIDGVTFSGGEPFCSCIPLSYLGKQLKDKGYSIITYTGYDFEYLLEHIDENGIGDLLNVTDILVDGKFILEKKSLEIKWRGSSNQRIIDVKSSLKAKKAIEIEI